MAETSSKEDFSATRPEVIENIVFPQLFVGIDFIDNFMDGLKGLLNTTITISP
jgi:hypothetical protein